jgi:hypothetical protein
MYEKMELQENQEDTATDPAGYTGNMRRVFVKDLKPITKQELIGLF